MGKKSNRHKERKQQMKQERQVEDAQIAEKQKIVDSANEVADPMEFLLPFKKYDRKGLQLAIACHRATNLPEEMIDWIFNLTKTNMQTLYENAGWGWIDQDKRKELCEDMAWQLIATDSTQDDKPVAFIHFRFDMDEGDAVLYCYEIQLVKEVRRKGLGKFLMQILELMAHKYNMEKVMLTQFKENASAQSFFSKALKYEIDETNPEETMAEMMFEEDGYTYEILSKNIMQKKKPLSAQNNSQSASTEVQ